MAELTREQRLEAALGKAQSRYDAAVAREADLAERLALLSLVDRNTVALDEERKRLEREREFERQRILATTAPPVDMGRFLNLEAEVAKLKEERRVTLDKRLSLFSLAMPASSDGHSLASRQMKNLYRKSKRDKTLICAVCLLKGLQVEATMAHIVPSNSKVDYTMFGPPKYQHNLKPSCVRNFIPLCGTLGAEGTCHNEFDKFLLSFLYDPFQRLYTILSLNEDWVHFDLNKSDIKFRHAPYRRLLAWRTKKCLLEHGSRLSDEEFTSIITMADLSEDSRSVANETKDSNV